MTESVRLPSRRKNPRQKISNMQVSDFHFDLPDELIARYPQPERTASRLLQLDGNSGELSMARLRMYLSKYSRAI